jgi:DNA polymerase-3 subunit gamma/tau
MSQVFYRKWRPKTLAEVVGQEPVTKTLSNALKSKRTSHAYLFCGPRGTGKTSTARIFAKAINCLNDNKGEPCNTCEMCLAINEGRALDIIEIDAASNTGVDDIRELREKVNYAPNQARYKVYIIDEVHMLSSSASNALLKTLEEPPAHVIFILATTEAHKILPTIMSRCQRFDFRRLSQTDVISKLDRICKTENIQIEPEALKLIARSATGSLRDAENLLEQMTTYYGSEISLEKVQSTLGITGDWRARELVKHIIGSDVSAGMNTINSVNSDGLDLRQFNRELISYLRALLLIKTGSAEMVDLTTEDIDELKKLAAKAQLSQVLRAVKLFGQIELGFDSYSTLPLELALVDCSLAAEEPRQGQPVEATHQTTQAKEKTEPSPVKAPEPPPIEPEPSVAEPESLAVESEPVDIAPEPVGVAPEPAASEAQADATPTNPTAPPAGASNETERLKLDWRQVIEQAPEDTRRTAAIAILRSAGVRPVEVKDDTVCLTFRYPYHKEQIEKPENQQVAEKIISNFLGRPCRVYCVLEDNQLLRAAMKMGAQIIETEE